MVYLKLERVGEIFGVKHDEIPAFISEVEAVLNDAVSPLRHRILQLEARLSHAADVLSATAKLVEDYHGQATTNT